MAEFQMKIAGTVGRVTALFQSTAAYCGRYLAAEPADFAVTVTPADLVRAQEKLNDEADREGLRRRKFTDPFLERTVIQEAFAHELFRRDVLLLHGSTLAMDGAAYLFTAPCGTGKSTHTRLWREEFGDRVVMVNDDKPFLEITRGGVIAHGAPWSGKHGLDTNISAPLGGICILARGRADRIRPMDAVEALPFLATQCHCPEDPAADERLRRLLQMLTARVPLWHMECTPTANAARTAYEAMHMDSL
ncbi:MAG: hypothetical protein E7436_05230 [Ruminococcaceae bacterium]|nr:hypothetical protein [Oscillospiraceae bacterium]